MMNEKELANNHALVNYSKEVLDDFVPVIDAINEYFLEPSEDNFKRLRSLAPTIRNLYRLIDDYTKAMADLKSKIDFAVVSGIQDSPEIANEFKVQAGAKSIKCDSRETSMMELMQRYVGAGFDPSGLFSVCTAITAKKAAEAFGMSEQAFLESNGDLFATHENRPSVKMR